MTVRNSFAGLPPFLFGDGGLQNQLVCDVRTYVRANDGSRDLLAPMLAWSAGPPAIGDTGDNSTSHMTGTTWLLQVCPDGSWVLYREDRGRLEVIPWDDPPDPVGPTARHVSLAFDQAARVALAWEEAGIIKVRRWDPSSNQYIENVSFAGVDPVIVFDATWAYLIPGSDVLLFYLSPDRTRVLCRVQRDVYATPYEIWDYGAGGGGFEYEVFTDSGTWDWTAAGQPDEVDVLVVAGGGGGGSRQGGGGGGAGGVVIETGVPVTADVAVTVGAGGAGAGVGAGADGQNGQASAFGGITATGGGGGGVSLNASNDTDGSPGGSGGGAGRSGANRPGGAGVAGQGHDGGTNAGANAGGAGGGGYSAVGESVSGNTPAAGGAGVTLDALGWGGATTAGAPPAIAGGGGGGDYGGEGGVGGGGAGSGTGRANGESGAPNTGGGGGGGGLSSGAHGSFTNGSGGSGGSGLVIVRWEGPSEETTSVILDRVIALPYRYQVLVADGTGAPLPDVLVSGLYPVPTFVRLAGDGVVLGGAYDQVAEALAHSLAVEGDGLIHEGLYEAPFSGIRHDLIVEGDGLVQSGRYRNVVTTYEQTVALEGDGVIHAGEYPQVATPLVHAVTVEGDGQIVGGSYVIP